MGVPYASHSVRARAVLIASMLLVCALIAGCGGDSGDDPSSAPPEVNLKDFPAANGQTPARAAGEAEPGRPRAGAVGVRAEGGGEPLRVRALRPLPQGNHRRPGGGLLSRRSAAAPRWARSRRASSRWRSSRSSRARPPRATPTRPSHVYVADIDFPKAGRLRRDRHGPARQPARGGAAGERPRPVVKKKSTVPDVGDPAPVIHTPTDHGRGRRLQRDRHAPAALEGAAQRGLRRRGRQEADRAACSPRRCCARAASAGPWWTSRSR